MIPQSILDFFHAGKSLPFRSMTYFNFLLEATLAGSVLILVVLVLRRVFRKRIGSRLVYLAWALVAIRLLLPVAIPNPLMDELRPTYSTDAGARPVADQVRVRYHDAMSDLSYALGRLEPENNTPLRQGASDLAFELSQYTAYGWLGKAYLLCYIVGGLVVFGVFGLRHGRFRRQMKKNAVGTLEGEQLELYQALCRHLKVKPFPVLLVDSLPSPCLVGVVKPVIALPVTLPPQALIEALMHELCHYKALDPWWVLVKCLCCAVHWFNPLVWVAQRCVKTDCELACDERVAAQLTEDERLHYANTLVLTAKQAYAPKAGVLATGMTMTGKRLKRRVEAIVHMRAVQRAAASLVAVVLVVLTVGAFSTAESVQQTVRLTTDQSAFAFEKGYIYPTPDADFGAPVALTPLTTAAEAEAQAKRYLLALFPEDRSAIDQCLYRIVLPHPQIWEVTAWFSDSSTYRYLISLKTGGSLERVTRNDLYAEGDYTLNRPSFLPDNLDAALLPYAKKIANIIFPDIVLSRGATVDDYDIPEARLISYILYDAENDRPLSLTLEIAPGFRLVSAYNATENPDNIAPEVNPPLEETPQRLVYTKDNSIAFDAVYWGTTDVAYTISSDAVLTLQQAFDIAVEAVLERSGLSPDALTELSLRYGFQDEIYNESDDDHWYFSWRVDDGDGNRHWIGFVDRVNPTNISYSAPGDGLG